MGFKDENSKEIKRVFRVEFLVYAENPISKILPYIWKIYPNWFKSVKTSFNLYLLLIGILILNLI